MSVIGNPITLGGGKVEKPEGNIYNAGNFSYEDITALISSNTTSVSDYGSYIRVDTPKDKWSYGGLVIGPMKFGNGYTVTGRGPSQYNIKLQCAAVLESKSHFISKHGNGDYTDNYEISHVTDLAQTTTGTSTINTTAFSGKTGYLFVVFVVDNYGYARADARITRVTAT